MNEVGIGNAEVGIGGSKTARSVPLAVSIIKQLATSIEY